MSNNPRVKNESNNNLNKTQQSIPVVYRKKILWNLRCAMLRRGRLAPDRTLRLGAEGTQPWRSVGRGMGNYADGPSCAQRPAQGHGTWGTSWGPSAKTVENASCTAAAITVQGALRSPCTVMANVLESEFSTHARCTGMTGTP
jgi:hypothetical protein